MINGLGVLGWGVGGIEAEAVLLGEPVSMLVPRVVGFRLSGELPEGATATDLVLSVTQILRAAGVVGKFVEYFGHGLVGLPLADRATIGNMSPEYGATCGFFPVDEETLRYMRLTGRSAQQVELVESVLPRAGPLPRSRPHARVLAGDRARPRRRRAEPRRAAPAAGPSTADRGEVVLPRVALELRRPIPQRLAGQGDRGHVSRERPGVDRGAWARVAQGDGGGETSRAGGRRSRRA